MRKTVLDLLLGNVTEKEREAFARAMHPFSKQDLFRMVRADATASDLADDLMKKIQRKAQEDEDEDSRGDGFTHQNSWDQAFRKLTRKLFGLERAPLDLSDEELDRLTHVIRDKTEQVSKQLKVTDRDFGHITPQEIKTKIRTFYANNRLMFNEPTDIGYDEARKEIHIESRHNVVVKFFEYLGLTDERIEQIMEGTDFTQDTKIEKDLILSDFGRKKKMPSEAECRRFVDHINTNLGRNGEVSGLQVEKNNAGKVSRVTISYDGSQNELVKFLKTDSDPLTKIFKKEFLSQLTVTK